MFVWKICVDKGEQFVCSGCFRRFICYLFCGVWSHALLFDLRARHEYTYRMQFFLHSFERHGAYDEAVAVVVLRYVHRDGIVLCGQFYFAHIDIFAIGVGVVV